jgi:hypothetical protein
MRYTRTHRPLSSIRNDHGELPMQVWLDEDLAVRTERVARTLGKPRGRFAAEVIAERVAEIEANALRLLAEQAAFAA